MMKKCADHLKHRNMFGTLSGMICGVRTSQRLLLLSYDVECIPIDGY